MSESSNLSTLGVDAVKCDDSARSFFANLLNDSMKMASSDRGKEMFTGSSINSGSLNSFISYLPTDSNNNTHNPFTFTFESRGARNRNLERNVSLQQQGSNDNNSKDEEENESIASHNSNNNNEEEEEEDPSSKLLIEAMTRHEVYETSFMPSHQQRKSNASYFENRFFLFPEQSINDHNRDKDTGDNEQQLPILLTSSLSSSSTSSMKCPVLLFKSTSL